MKRLLSAVLTALCTILLLAGCGKDGEDTPSVVVEPLLESDMATPAPSDDTQADTPPEDSDTPPEPGMVRSRITNEWVKEEVNNTRPIAIMIPNTRSASQFGISKADVLYEVNVESDMTRLMAVINDWKDLDKIGNIRSCRDYFVYWAFEWDPLYIHYGGPFYIDEIIGRDDTQNIDCLTYNEGAYRDQAKDTTDNSFTSGERIKKAADHFGYPLTYREGYADAQHYRFAPFDEPNTLEQYEKSFTATKADMSKAYSMTCSYFIYNEETGTYDRYQHIPKTDDGPHVDLLNNQQLTFKNLIVQNTYFEKRDAKRYLAFQCHDTTRDGWYFTNGRGIHVTWKKESDYGATRYYDDDGNEVLFNTGKTMVCIVEDGDAVMVDDKAYSSNAGN